MKEGRQSLTQNNGFVLSCLSGTDLFPLSSSEHVILGVLVFFLLSLPEMTFSSHSGQWRIQCPSGLLDINASRLGPCWCLYGCRKTVRVNSNCRDQVILTPLLNLLPPLADNPRLFADMVAIWGQTCLIPSWPHLSTLCGTGTLRRSVITGDAGRRDAALAWVLMKENASASLVGRIQLHPLECTGCSGYGPPWQGSVAVLLAAFSGSHSHDTPTRNERCSQPL